MSDELLELAARCEAASGVDRELDCAIYEAVSGDKAVLSKFGWEERGGYNVARYTQSLDAAMTLVPEGWRVGDLSQHDHEILRAKGDWTSWVYEDGKLEPVTGDRPRCRYAASAPLALTAAALHARASRLRMEVE